MKKFLYFQPEYIGKFKCDGSKCDARCCKGWTITIDAATYKKYSKLKPKSIAKEITSRMKFDSERGVYVITLAETKEDFLWQKNFSTSSPNTSADLNAVGGGLCSNNCCDRPWAIDIDAATYKKYSKLKPKDTAKEITSHIEYDESKKSYMLQGRPCPFLTEDCLCGIQLNYGEEFLSQTCVTYPRRTHAVGKFFERSLTLTCPVAAELILFNQEPMKFEFVEVPEKIHSKHGRIRIKKIPVNEKNAEILRETQITMISILQERRLSLDARLIVLGFFLDKLQEIISDDTGIEMVLDLIAAYRSEKFLLNEMLPLLQGFNFDAKKFITFMIKFINHTMKLLRTEKGLKFLVALENVLNIKPDENNQVSLIEIAANYNRLAEARKNFLADYSTFLENYIVNELFYSLYPWRFLDKDITKNFAIFLISYKIFEMMTFAAVQGGLNSKEDLLQMVDWFMSKTNHRRDLYERFFELLEGVDDTYLLMDILLDRD